MYPESIYSPRFKENMPGVEYDPDKSTVLFMEDIEYGDDETIAVQETLGTLDEDHPVPEGGYLPYLDQIEKNKYKLRQTIPYSIPGNLPSGMSIAVPITPGMVAPEPFITAVGGRVRITRAPVLDEFYSILVNYQRISATSWQIYLTYKNESTLALSNSVSIPVGATVSLDPTIMFIADFNPNIFAPNFPIPE